MSAPPPLLDAADPQLAQMGRAVRLLVLDADGVLTDGRLYYGPDGEALKVFDVRDGHGLAMLRPTELQVAVISGRGHPALELRCKELGVAHLVQRCYDKGKALRELLAELDLQPEQCCCVGDDTPDRALFEICALPVAVADAEAEILAMARARTARPGGRGAVREVCDFLLACGAGGP